MTTSRRSFIQAAGATVAAGVAQGAFASQKLFRAIGITAKVERSAELKTLGAEFIVESVADFLMPFAPDAQFAAAKARAKASVLPIRGCNSFMRDPSLICVGPNADHPRVLAYVDTAFKRLKEVGGEYVVFGSNSARRMPDGWTKPKADEQFVSLLKAMGPIAKSHGVTVGLEMLSARECNYLNHIDEVVSVLQQVNHPNIRVLADLYHMRVMGDTPGQLAAAMPWVGVVELAERDKRTVPGVAGDDFTPYFSVLARGGYRGVIDIEADGTAEELRKAFATVAKQAAQAMQDAA